MPDRMTYPIWVLQEGIQAIFAKASIYVRSHGLASSSSGPQEGRSGLHC